MITEKPKRNKLNVRLVRRVVSALTFSLIGAWSAEALVNSVGWLGHVELAISPNRGIVPSPSIIVIEQTMQTPSKLGIQGTFTTIPRRFHAELLKGLKAAGARVVVLDYHFDDEQKDDEVVQAALQDASPMDVVLGYAPRLDVPVTFTPGPTTSFLGNFCMPAVAALNLHEGSLTPWNPDQVLRGFFIKYRNKLSDDAAADIFYPHVAVAAVLAFSHLPQESLQLSPDGTSFDAGLFHWPVGPTYEYRSRWTSPSHSFPTLEYAEALAKLKSADQRKVFSGEIVVVGSIAQQNEDYIVEGNRHMWGVQIVAQFINSLIEPATNQTVLTSVRTNALWCFAVGLLSSLLVGSLRPRAVASALVLACLLSIGGPRLLLSVSGVRLETLAPFMAGLFAVLASLAMAAIRVQRHDPLYERVPGRAVDVAIMFVDLKGSTAAISMMDLDPASDMLHDVLETLTRVIKQHGGVIERMVGDGAMAFWAAQRGRKHADTHLLKCLDTAQALEVAFAQLDAELEKRYKRRAAVSIGIESGEVVGRLVAKSGHEEWSWFGISIHLAARLQSYCSEAKVDLCIGPDIAKRVGNRRRLRQVAEAAFKGFDGETQVFTLESIETTKL